MPVLLKALELQGYKTFASRTVFQFAGTITAIVGPNGSGKSNIADSLRWVLGEQSYSLLRGKKTEDMIFAGSEHRTRASMASATITFDNSDGWLPIDFSEVAITRRAYRDGQNEYLINGQRVRLRDVSELLAQSGLAERTYTIIGQGLVDAALALKAEERRRLFEEAAGIGLHRARREEALHRLDTTRRNLERVQDILAELQPRLRSLEKQARRAREYEQIKADLQVLLREWYGYHWHRTQTDLKEALAVARAREAALERARQEQLKLDEQLAGLRGRVQNMRNSLNSWHRLSAQLHNRREGLSRDLAVAEERIRSLQGQEQDFQTELTRLREELSLYQEQCMQAGQDVQRLTGELSEARAHAEAARQALAARQAAHARAEGELQSARQALSALYTRQGQLQARLAERQAAVERSRLALETSGQAVSAAEGELQAAQARADATRTAVRQTAAARQGTDEAVQAHRQQLTQVEAARQTALDQRSALAADLARLKAQLEVLGQAEAALTGYTGGTRLLLQAARQARLQGARGALSSLLDVPAKFEQAIAAALGEYLDGVLLDGEPEQALDLLMDQSVRGVLLPLPALRPGTLVELSTNGDAVKAEGILGVAAGLVGAPPELRPVIDLLLGQVLIVRDRPAARRALSGGTGGMRTVTLAGEVFLASGPVLAGGSGSGSNGQTVLGRQRQRRELDESLAETGRQMAASNERVVKLDEDLKALQAERERLGRGQFLARQEEEKASLAADQARLAAEQAAKQVHWHQEQRGRLLGEISRGEDEAAQMAHDLANLETEISQAREHLRQHNNSLAALTVEEFQSQVSYWTTQAAVADRALVDGKSRQRERQATLDRSQGAHAALEARLAEIATTRATLDGEKAARRQEEGITSKEIETLRNLIDPAEAELETVELEQAGVQNAEAAVRQTLSQAEHHHAQARIGLARRQEALSGLRRRIEDDFGLVAFEYAENVSGPTPLPLEGMVEQLPMVSQINPEVEEALHRQRAQLRRIGAVNPEAQAEYQEVGQRYAFLTEQVADLRNAEVSVRQVIAELDSLMQREFQKTFEAVAAEFKLTFTRLFGGGSAQLILTNPDDLTNTGIDIEARLPGRRSQGLSLLSGGERSLTAVSLVFALLKISPTPFCVLDEVDAMLDEANVGRFRELLRELSQNTQFVVVTHNRNTVQVADVIYGVTMGRDSASQVISLKLDEVGQVVD